jgi:aspartyl protease family protein
MRPILFFAFVALAAALLLPRHMGQFGSASPARPAAPAPALTPAPTAQVADAAPSYGASRVIIEPDAHGHFRVEGAIDGRRLDFLVDTGASVVTLTETDAARLGFRPMPRDYVAQFKTANGTVRGAPVRLDLVEIGRLTVRNVPGVVLADEALSQNLLGLSFLSRLRRFEYRDRRLVLED